MSKAKRRSVKLADVDELFHAAFNQLNSSSDMYLRTDRKVGDPNAVGSYRKDLEKALLKVGPQLGYRIGRDGEESDE